MAKWTGEERPTKKHPCPVCGGSGTVWLDDIDPGRARNEITCRECNGSGER